MAGGIMQLIAMGRQDIYLTGSRPQWTCAPRGAMNNSTCPITLSEITHDVEYSTCDTCRYNISFNALVDWLNVKAECPCCRSRWTNYVKYI